MAKGTNWRRFAAKQLAENVAVQARALAIMCELAEESARLDLLCHSVGLMFGVPKGAFAAALRARKGAKR